MSLKAIVWALERAPVYSSSQKFVLVALANYANEENHSYPQVATICRVTAQSDDTVRRCLASLEEAGNIRDTLKRFGPTQQVKVWELLLDQPKPKAKDPQDAELTPTKDPQDAELKDPQDAELAPPQDPQDAGLTPTKDPRKTRGRPAPCGSNLGTKEPKPKAGAEAPVEEEGKEKPKAKAKTVDVRPIIAPWCEEYARTHGWKYRFNGNIDGPAAVRLIKSGIPIEELISVARQAWANPTGFYSKQAATLAGFDSKLNEIRKELAALRRPGGSLPGTNRAPKDTLNRGF